MESKNTDACQICLLAHNPGWTAPALHMTPLRPVYSDKPSVFWQSHSSFGERSRPTAENPPSECPPIPSRHPARSVPHTQKYGSVSSRYCLFRSHTRYDISFLCSLPDQKYWRVHPWCAFSQLLPAVPENAHSSAGKSGLPDGNALRTSHWSAGSPDHRTPPPSCGIRHHRACSILCFPYNSILFS